MASLRWTVGELQQRADAAERHAAELTQAYHTHERVIDELHRRAEAAEDALAAAEYEVQQAEAEGRSPLEIRLEHALALSQTGLQAARRDAAAWAERVDTERVERQTEVATLKQQMKSAVREVSKAAAERETAYQVGVGCCCCCCLVWPSAAGEV